MALVPFFAGVASAVRGHFILHRFIEGLDLGARRAARMYLDGTRASESTLVIGAVMTACAMLLVGLVGLLRVRAALVAIASASAVLFASLAMYGIAKGRALNALTAYSVGAIEDAQRTRDLTLALSSMRFAPLLGFAGARVLRADPARSRRSSTARPLPPTSSFSPRARALRISSCASMDQRPGCGVRRTWTRLCPWEPTAAPSPSAALSLRRSSRPTVR